MEEKRAIPLEIDFGSKLPLYYQLREKLRMNILNGSLQEGDLVPSERELSEQFNLSSTTIRRALNDLVHEELLERKPGKGTFVRIKKVTRDLKKVLSFTQNMKDMGLTPSTKVLSKQVVAANGFVEDFLGIQKGREVYRIERLRMGNNVAMMLETRYIRMDLCPNIIDLDLSSSLWNVFETVYGLKPHRYTQTLGIAHVSGSSAELLGLNDRAVTYLIKGVTRLKNGDPIECEESLYRSDKYELTFEAVAE